VSKICEMESVRERTGGHPVELWRNSESGRLVIRAKNESGNNVTEVDLWDVIQWFTGGPHMEIRQRRNDFAGGGEGP
jgi:hypothetical protein